ncbi:MAG: putative 2OG-Fe(II) oxygenase [Gammaproteobacteria bacterium]
MSAENAPSLSITPAFATPIFDTRLPNCEELNLRLRDLFLKWEQDPNRKRSSAPTGVAKVEVYESDFALFSNPEPEIQALRQFSLNTLGYLIAQLNHYSGEEMARLRIFEHSWYHLTRHTGYTAKHNHPMASWSGIYCVDPGDAVPDKINSGATRFFDTRTSASMYLDPANSYLQSPYGFGDIAYTLVPGQFLLFPSYLLHEVAPYFGTRERITVAFNAWVREAGAPVDVPSIKQR